MSGLSARDFADRPAKALRRVCLATLLLLLAGAAGSRVSSQATLTIGGYQLVSEQTQKNAVISTYRATLTNTGGALASATATIKSIPGSTKAVDGALSFGPVGTGGSVVSTDTFSVNRKPDVPFNPSTIVWTITSTPNHPPVANAGPDFTRLVTQTAQLDGSGSTDVDGNPLTYQWSFISRPAGSQATLSSATAVKPTFVVDQPGSYTVRLIVNDGFVNSVADTVTVTTLNSPPVANAGPDQTTFLRQTVTLNGSASSDVDGNPLHFSWSFVSRPSGSAAVLTNPTSVMPTFVVDVAGTYVVRLIVNDGFDNSAADTVSITTQNSPPVANAGPDQSVFVTNVVALDGSGSTDVDGNLLTYAWSLITKPSGSQAALNNSTAVRPTFVVDRPGTYVAQLMVNDGFVPSAADTVTISTLNSAPVANAGPDQTVVAGRIALLDGTASSDADGDQLTFRWSLTTVPTGSTTRLLSADTALPSFVLDREGTYVAQLIVNDGTVDSAPDTVTIRTTNSVPTANAGADQLTAIVEQPVTLNGTLSSDPDNQPLNFWWSFLSKPPSSNATFPDSTSAQPGFTPDVAGDYVAQLIVNDGFTDSAPDTVLIRANSFPFAHAGSDQQVTVGDTVHLDGSGSFDPDGDAISYLWEITSRPPGSVAALQGPASASPTFVVDVAGQYAVQLTVTDTAGASAIDSVLVTASAAPSEAPAIVMYPTDLTVTAGEEATFGAAATGIPMPAVQWQVSTNGGATFNDVPGATAPTLIFTTTPQDNGKKFRAVFTNGAGTATTTAATLTVVVPTIDERVPVGDTVIINGAPLLAPLANRTIDADTLVQFTAVAVDPGDSLIFSLVGAPPGAAINAANGAFSWTPTQAQAPGVYPFAVVATDTGGLSAQRTVTISVNRFTHAFDDSVPVDDAVIINGAPLLAPLTNQTVDADALVQFTAVATDPGDAVIFTLLNAPAGAAINPLTGVFSWTPTQAQAPGTYPFTVMATDSGGLTAQRGITITVRAPSATPHVVNEAVLVTDVVGVNGAPLLAALTDQTVDAETLVQFVATGIDPGDLLTFSLLNAPARAVISPQTGVFAWTPTQAQAPGTYQFTVVVTDSGGLSAQRPITITVRPFVQAIGEPIRLTDVVSLNGAPLLAPLTDQTVDAETLVQFVATAIDPGDVLTFSLLNAPPGAAINPQTGVFNWTPTQAQAPGTYQFTVVVTDSGGLSAQRPITITVRPFVQATGEPIRLTDVVSLNGAPLLAPLTDQTVNAETLVQFVATAIDPGDVLTFSLLNAPAGAAINPQTGVFNWTPTQAQAPGTYQFFVVVTDSGGLSAERPITITVRPFVQAIGEPIRLTDVVSLNGAPLLAPLTDQTVNAETLVQFVATAIDPGDVLTFSLLNAPTGAAINPQTGVFNWTPTQAQAPGSYSFFVVVTDNGGLSAQRPITITVRPFVQAVSEPIRLTDVVSLNGAPLLAPLTDQTVNAETLVQFVATAIDPGDVLTFSLLNAPAGAAINPQTGAFSWTPTQSQAPGTYPFMVVVTDSGGLTAQRSLTISVNPLVHATSDDVHLGDQVEVNAAPILAPLGNLTVDADTPVQFTAIATDLGDTLTFSLLNAPTGAAINPQTGVFSWTPSQSQAPGTYPFTVVVTDSGELMAERSLTITVNPFVHATSDDVHLGDQVEVNAAPILAPLGNLTVDADTLVQFTAIATDLGDTLTFSVVNAPAGAAINPQTGAFSWTPSQSQAPGTYPFTVVVTDSGGLMAERSLTITVNPFVHATSDDVHLGDQVEVNAAPILAPLGDLTVNADTLVQFSAMATDLGDTLTFSLLNAPTGAAINPQMGVFSWTPSQSQAPGTYPFTVVVTDSGGLMAERSLTITVNPFVHATSDDVHLGDQVEVNAAPILAPLGNLTVDADTLVQFTAMATDLGDTLTFSLLNAPAGAAINPQTGVFSWTPNQSQSPGTYPFTVVVADSGGLMTERSLTITVNPFVHATSDDVHLGDQVEVNAAPILDALANLEVDATRLVEFVAHATDLGDTLTFSLSGAPSGARINAQSGVFIWTPSEAQAPSIYTFYVVVTDSGALSAQQPVTITVRPYVHVIDESVTIDDDSKTLPVVSVTAVGANASEAGPAPGMFRFTRTGDITSGATVNFTMSGTATNGVDYAQLSGTVSFAAGQAFVDLPIVPVDDSTLEPDETAIVTLIDGIDYRIAAPVTAMVTITDNDQRPPFNVGSAASVTSTTMTVTFDAPPNATEATTLANYAVPGLTLSGTSQLADNTVTLTTSTQSDALYTVSVTGVTRADDGERLTTNSAVFTGHAPGIVSVAALDPSGSEIGSDPAAFRLTRDGDTTSGLTVSVTIGGTATNGVDYQPALNEFIVFQPGEAFVDVTITPVDDSVVEGSETVVLTVNPGSDYALGIATSASIAIADSELVVTNTGDSGPGSLRQAILDANAHTGTDTVSFAIPGSGPYTIALVSALPAISEAAVIDGTTQPGYAAQPLIELDGTGAGGATSGLVITGGHTTVRGLVINRFGNGGTGPGGAGIVLQAGGSNVVQGNVIGADTTGAAATNRGQGILIDGSDSNMIGGPAAQANTIAFNAGAGIAILAGSGNVINTNSIASNGGLGIDLGDDGVTPNDSDDQDAGPNGLQNFPIITSAVSANGTTRIQGTLDSLPDSPVTIQLFANPTNVCDPSGYGEGAQPLGAQTLSTDAVGHLAFDIELPIVLSTGQFVTATATHLTGGTSEFSACADVNPFVTVTTQTPSLLTGQTGQLKVTLSHPAGVGGVPITFTSDSAAVAAPDPVTIPVNETTVDVPIAAGTTSGTAIITAAASGFASGSTSIAVSLRTMTLTATSPLVAVGHTLTGTLTLDQAAVADVIAALVSDNPSKVSVSTSTLTIGANNSSLTFVISGNAAGSAILTATTAGYAPATLSITATTSSLISLGSNVTVAPGNEVGLALSLGTPAPAGGVTVMLSSTDTSIATVSSSVFIPENLQIPAANPIVHGVAIGSTQIIATAGGFAPDAATVNVTLSISLSPNALDIVQGVTSNATLTLSAPAPAGGLTFNTSVDDPAIASVGNAVHISAGSTTVPIPVTALLIGNTTLRAGAAGISPASTGVSVHAAPVISVSDATVGQNLQVAMSGLLGAPAPAGNLQLTITSSAPGQVLLSTSATAVGSGQITVTVNAGQSQIPTLYVQALGASGTVIMTTTAPGYATDTSDITLQPSGFVLGTGNISTWTSSSNTPVSVIARMLTPTLDPSTSQSVRAGLSIDVPISSSNTSVGRIVADVQTFIPIDHVRFVGGESSKAVAFDPVGSGSTTISLGTPASFSTPTTGRQITATVAVSPSITVADVSIGKDLQIGLSGTIGAPAPAGNLDVTIHSPDPSSVLLSKTATPLPGEQDGYADITVTVGAGSTSIPTFYVQVLNNTGTVDLQITADDYATDTSRVTLTPSAFIISTNDFTTTSFSTNTTVSVSLQRLNVVANPPGFAAAGAQGLRAGKTASVTLSSSDENVGTIVNPTLTFNATESSKSAAFDPVGGGTATVSVSQPAGFEASPSLHQSITATVTAPAITLFDQTIGKDLQISTSGSLGAAVPSGTTLTVTVTSDDPSKAVLSTSSTVLGGASLQLTVNANQSGTPVFYVQALTDTGTVLIRATAPGYTSDTATITFQPSGFVFSTGSVSTTTFSGLTTVTVGARRLTPQGNPPTYLAGPQQALRAGLTVAVPVISSDTNVGDIVSLTSPNPLVSGVIFDANEANQSVGFDPKTGGTSTISLGTPTETNGHPIDFKTATTGQSITATVAAPNITVFSATVGRDLQTTTSISLAAAPPSPVDVTVTVANASIATITRTGTAAGSTSVTFQGVTGTSVGSIFVQGLSLGSTSITVHAAGYNDGSATVTVQPSGFVLTPRTISPTKYSINQTLTVSSQRLDPTTKNALGSQAIRGGLSPITVSLTNSDASVGALIDATPGDGTTSVVFNSTDSSKTVQFDPLNIGTTTISVVQPPGFDQPGSNTWFTTATVTTPDITISGSAIVGVDLQTSLSISLEDPPPTGIDVTITSSDGAVLTLVASANKTQAGSASMMVQNVTTTSVGTIYVQGRSLGTATITVQAPGYNSVTTTTTVNPSGFFILSPSSISTSPSQANTTVTVRAAYLNPTTLNTVAAQDLRGGLSSINVPITSSKTNIGVIIGTLSFTGGDTSKTVQFDPVATGTTNINLGSATPAPNNFSTPSDRQTILATVN